MTSANLRLALIGCSCLAWAVAGGCSDDDDPAPFQVVVPELSFSDSGQVFFTGGALAVISSDVDGDADPDVVISFLDAGSRVFTNDGLGTFTDTGQSLLPALPPFGQVWGFALGDVDLDGDGDLAVAASGGTTIWVNDGAGAFSDSGQVLSAAQTDASGYTPRFADVDRDGAVDLVVGEHDHLGVYLNDGTGVFTLVQDLPALDAFTLAVGDLDGDGDVDLVARDVAPPPSGASDARVFLNDGAGAFSPGAWVPANGRVNVTQLHLGDVDGDGDLDFVGAALGSAASTGFFVVLNPGDGDLASGSVLEYRRLGGATTTWLTVADLDGNGELDVVTHQDGADTNVVLSWGTHRLGVSATLPAAPSMHVRSVAVDVNADGFLDVLEVFEDPATARLHLNQGYVP